MHDIHFSYRADRQTDRHESKTIRICSRRLIVLHKIQTYKIDSRNLSQPPDHAPHRPSRAPQSGKRRLERISFNGKELSPNTQPHCSRSLQRNKQFENNPPKIRKQSTLATCKRPTQIRGSESAEQQRT